MGEVVVGGEEERVVSLFLPGVAGRIIFYHLCVNLTATSLTVIYNSLLNHNTNVPSVKVIF